MSTFASEKRAPGICDRCGHRYPLRRMRSEVIQGKKVNNRVCPRCHDEDHPQNWLGRVKVVEREGLRDPRSPGADEVAGSRSRPGWNPVGNEAVRMKMFVGQVYVTIG